MGLRIRPTRKSPARPGALFLRQVRHFDANVDAMTSALRFPEKCLRASDNLIYFCFTGLITHLSMLRFQGSSAYLLPLSFSAPVTSGLTVARVSSYKDPLPCQDWLTEKMTVSQAAPRNCLRRIGRSLVHRDALDHTPTTHTVVPALTRPASTSASLKAQPVGTDHDEPPVKGMHGYFLSYCYEVSRKLKLVFFSFCLLSRGRGRNEIERSDISAGQVSSSYSP